MRKYGSKAGHVVWHGSAGTCQIGPTFSHTSTPAPPMAHLSVVQLSLNVDLALRDVTRQVGDGVRDVVIRHGENGQLRDGALAPLDTAGALVDGRQIRVHVA